MSGLELLAIFPLAFWLLLGLDRARRWPRKWMLPAPETAPPGEATVVAVVPARDEAEVLPATLPSLLAQTGPTLDVVLVDDGSSDGSAEVARRLAAAAGAGERLRVIAAGDRPEGWSGKLWALSRGVAEARRWRGQAIEEGWLLLTDADIRHREGAVASLLRQAASPAGPYDLVSVMARLSVASFWEKLLVPPFVFFFQLLYPFRRVAKPDSRVAAAAGGCVLLSARALHRAGGFEPIRGAVIDDVALARRLRDGGARLWLGLDPGIVSVRSYGGLAGIWSTVARTAFEQLGRRLAALAATLAALALLVASPPWLLAVSAAVHLSEVPQPALGPARAVVWAFLAWALQALALLPAVRHQRAPPIYAWSLPFAALLFGAMTISSAWRELRGRGPRWKGRTLDR